MGAKSFRGGLPVSIRILLLEDDKLFGESIEEFLSEEGYEVDLAQNLAEAMEYGYHKRYDLYLFDVKLPDGDGFGYLEEIRRLDDETPAIFITSKNQKSDVKEGLSKGADDYLVKPVDLEELLLRIKAVLRRCYGEEIVQIDQFRFDLKCLQLSQSGQIVELNPKELELLALFVKNRKKVVPKERIYQHLWKPDEIVSDGALRVYINSLKKVLGKDAITNIRGVGYRFEK